MSGHMADIVELFDARNRSRHAERMFRRREDQGNHLSIAY